MYIGLIWLQILNWPHAILEYNMRKFVVKSGHQNDMSW